MQQKIIPNLWFDTEAEEAAGFYILGGGVLPDHLRDPGRVNYYWDQLSVRPTGRR